MAVTKKKDFVTYDRGVEAYADKEVLQGPVCHHGGVRSYGSIDSGVVFIGISPARDEVERSRRPLTGPSGQLLDAALGAIGQDRSKVYCTNVVCRWMNEPTKEDISQCQERLDYELSTIKPKLIILLGKIVAEHFMGRSFSSLRGAVQWSDKYDCYIMTTYHPSAILHGMGEGSGKDDNSTKFIYDFIRDLRKIPEVTKWERGAPQSKVRYRVVHNWQEAQNVLDNLPRSEDYPIALDVETTYGKDDEEADAFKDDVLCVGIGSDNYCWVFAPGALYKEDGTPALTWPDLHWTMHNAIFDSGVMRRKLGTWINVCEDTMLQSYSLDERSGVHRLKSLSREYLAAGFYEEDRFYRKKKLDEIPKEMLYEYNAKDVVYTARLTKLLKEKQLDDNVRDFYLKILIPAVNVYKEAQYHGVNIDERMLLKFTWEWGHRIQNEEAELQEMAQELGWDGEINLQSTEQLGRLLFQIMSFPCEKRTKGGKPSVDKEVLEKLQHQHEFIPKLISLRRLYKMWGTYVVGLPEQLRVDGRAHPVVKLHGTETGRPAYTGLAVQTFVAPSAPHEFNQMRKLVIPPEYTGYNGTDDYVAKDKGEDEYVIVEVDFGKAELWVAQSNSNDQQMLEDLLSGDYHTRTAMDIYEKERHEITGDDRTWAKRTTFGILYYVEENTLAKLTHSTPQDAAYRIKRWKARNATYTKWARGIEATIKREGELVSKTGRKRRIIILGNAVRAAKQAVNYPIQSTSSDVVLASTILVAPAIKRIGGHLLFTVHDSIVTIALKSRLKEHCQIMHDIMTQQHFEGIKPIPVEVKVGQSWGDVKGIHDCAEHSTKGNTYNISLEDECTWRNLYEH